MALLHEETRGRDPDPSLRPAVVRAWGLLALGLWELAVLKMGFAKEFSASGFALIIGYL